MVCVMEVSHVSLTLTESQCLLLDVCLKEVPSIADSLYNIQLLREFSNEYLDRGFYLRPEDLLYAPPVLKVRFLPLSLRLLSESTL